MNATAAGTQQQHGCQERLERNETKKLIQAIKCFHTTSVVCATQFGGCRIPEIRPLVTATTQQQSSNANCFQSGGRKTSSRHLRRRAKSFRPVRFYTKSKRKQQNDETNAGKQQQSRRAKRQRKSTLCEPHETWRKNSSPTTITAITTPDSPTTTSNDNEPTKKSSSPTNPSNNNEPTNPTTTVAPHHWMLTHLWHAKRFRMMKQWCWSIPLVHSNRGCTAAVRLAQTKCTVYDATWLMNRPLRYTITSSSNDEAVLQRSIQTMIHDFTLQTHAIVSSGESMVHAPNQFPQTPVCPIQWFQIQETNSDEPRKMTLLFFVHPSVQNTVHTFFESVMNDIPPISSKTVETATNADETNLTNFGKHGIVCFKLCGKYAKECLLSSYSTFIQQQSSSNDDDTAQSSSLNLPADKHGLVTYTVSSILGILLLRRSNPRPNTSAKNCVVSGYDLYFDAAKKPVLQFWNTVVLHACPIGYCEYTNLSMQCIPPLPIFPRDYPDTESGVRYWRNDDDEWKCVREHWQGGGGRIRRNSKNNSNDDVVHWGELIGGDNDKQSDDAIPENVVVIRGCYADPIRAALQNSCVTKPSWTKQRRSHVQKFYTVPTKRLTGSDVDQHYDTCKTLLQSLTLPAILLCYVKVLGKGILLPGTKLYPYSSNSNSACIAMVTTGDFCHGHYHALCMSSARVVLQTIHDLNDCVYVASSNSTKVTTYTVQIRVKTTTTVVEAILSIL